MRLFQYKARIKGKVINDEIQAEDENSAIASLKQKNIRPIYIEEIKKKKAFNNGKPLFGSGKQRITEKDIVIFTRTFPP